MKHERRWASDSVPDNAAAPDHHDHEEFVEVTLDLHGDDTVILRSVEPAANTTSTVINIDVDASTYAPSEASASASVSSATRSPSMRRSSSSRLRQFSQELKAEAVAKARHFSQELKAELVRRFSWNQGHASRVLSTSTSNNGSGYDSALAARALRKQRAQLDRTRSGARKALRGLKFISNSKADAWNEVQANFYKLAKDGYLYRADFAQCIGFNSFFSGYDDLLREIKCC